MQVGGVYLIGVSGWSGEGGVSQDGRGRGGGGVFPVPPSVYTMKPLI